MPPCSSTPDPDRGLNIPGIIHARRATRLPGAGLQHHQPMVHLLQDIMVDGVCYVGQLVRVRGHIVHFCTQLQWTHKDGGESTARCGISRWERESKHADLVILELAVLQVGRGGDRAHTRVGVVVRILTHTVRETLLWEDESRRERFTVALYKMWGAESGSYRHPRPQQRACWVGDVASFSFVLHQEVCPPAAVGFPLLVDI